MRIYLTGFMGSGKSSIGKKIASQLGYQFIDLDQMIEDRHKTPISRIFEQYDETAFRIIENKTLRLTDEFEKTVIATGGGTACFHNNMDWMKENGITVYLKMHPKSLFHRLVKAKKKRPLLADKTEQQLQQFIDEQLTHREPYYNKAHIILPGESLNLTRLYDEIHKIIEKRKNLQLSK